MNQIYLFLSQGKDTQENKEEVAEGSKTYTLFDLFKTPNMRKKTLNSYVNW